MFGGRKTVVAKWLRNASRACDCRIFVPSVNVSSPAASYGKAVGMPATTIHFVRHGKVENPGHLLYERLPGFHLSEVGVRMAQATAHYIAVSPQLNTVSAIYSSPLERTRETAGEILTALNEVRGAAGTHHRRAHHRSTQRIPRHAHRLRRRRALEKRQLETGA